MSKEDSRTKASVFFDIRDRAEKLTANDIVSVAKRKNLELQHRRPTSLQAGAEYILSWLRLNGITQTDIAKKYDCSAATVRKAYESILHALDISTSDFWGFCQYYDLACYAFIDELLERLEKSKE